MLGFKHSILHCQSENLQQDPVRQNAPQHNARVIRVANSAASGAFPVTGSLAGGSPLGDNLLAGGSPVVHNHLAEGLEGNPAPQSICSTMKPG